MSKTIVIPILSLAALLAPSAAHAAVVVSEIAWMGTSVSANAEWIELQNTDATVTNLSGWTLVSSTGSPAIALTGTISANGFYLLERTSDASVPDMTADQIYSGALPNTGITFTLKDATGAVVDTVSGGTDWKSIGGDNVTKQTPQRNGSVWVTAVATPRALNSTGNTGTSGTGTTTTEDTSTPVPSVGGSPIVPTVSFSNPIPRLRMVLGPGRIVAAGARVPYEAHVYDEYGNVRNDINYTWTFGDGDVAYGREVEHTYAVPGTYLVVIHGMSGPSTVTATLTVRADPVTAHIARVDDAGVTVVNDSAAVLDLSFWKLTSGTESFMFPRYTALLPHGEVTFASRVTGFATTTKEIALTFPDGRPVASSSPSQVPEVPVVETPTASPQSVVQPVLPVLGIQTVGKEDIQIVTNATDTYEEATSAPSTPVDPGVLGASVGSFAPLLKSPWTASFFGLLLAAGAALVIL